MTQNRSSAVMHQRSEAHDSLDDFPTPPWATRAAIEYGIMPLLDKPERGIHRMTAREPCANRGYMVKPLQEYFLHIVASDIYDYGMPDFQFEQLDYLWHGPMKPADVVMMNAPFNLNLQFIQKSFDTPGWRATGALVRTGFLEGIERYKKLYKLNPPTVILFFTERVVMHKGVLRNPEIDYWDFEAKRWKRATSATSYCWLLWIEGTAPMAPVWIPPCRKKLERPGDYPVNPDERGVFDPEAQR